MRFESIDALCDAKSDAGVPPLTAGFALTGNYSQRRNLGSPPHGFPDKFLSVHDRMHNPTLRAMAEMAIAETTEPTWAGSLRSLFFVEGGDAGEGFAFEEFEGGAAAG